MKAGQTCSPPRHQPDKPANHDISVVLHPTMVVEEYDPALFVLNTSLAKGIFKIYNLTLFELNITHKLFFISQY